MKSIIKRFFHNYFSNTIKIKNSFGKYKLVHIAFILPLQNNFLYKFFFKNHPNVFELDNFICSVRNLAKEIVITDYRYTKIIKSDLLIGFGQAFTNSLPYSSKSILYSTGASALLQNKFVHDEIGHIGSSYYGFESSKYFRFSDKYSEINEEKSKFILSIGNDFTVNTFGKNKDKVISLPGIPLGSEKKNKKSINRNKILWVGSKGVLHKGLHIAADFAKSLNLELIAIGVDKTEQDIAVKVLKFSGCKFKIYGQIKIPSSKWYSITDDISFVIGVSVSEGMSTSILTCVNRGLYPLTVDRCGISYGNIVDFEPRISLVKRLSNDFEKLISMSDNYINSKIEIFQGLIEKKNTNEAFLEIIKKTIQLYDSN